jgi:pimeloyl-ACP methyl ester carboxylesterase
VRRGTLVITVVLGLLALGCGSSEAKSPSLEHRGSTASFYRPPASLAGARHGDLLRYQRLGTVAGGVVYRVMYRSQSVGGKAIAVTGMVAVPRTGGGNRPVLSWAHGTVGLADRCTPSKQPLGPFEAALAALLAKGWVVAATDYEGLGPPGRHPYLAGVSEGRGVLDVIRAARQIPQARAGNRALLWGHSQGGHAVLFAAQLAARWVPETKVVGTVAGAPPSELPLLTTALKGGAFQGYIAMAAAGLNAAYPKAALSPVLTPKGLELLAVVDRGCTDEIFRVFNTVGFDEVIKADPMTVPAWKAVLEANDPGHVKLPMPLLVIHGEADEQIPPVASQALVGRLCGLGQVAERRTYPGMGHAEVIAPSFVPMVAWMGDRLAGRPAVSTCPKP